MSSVTASLAAFEIYKNSEGSYDIPKETLMKLINAKLKKKSCQKTSGYMKWLAENRESIKNQYFSDLAEHDSDFWTIENKTQYYEEHGIKLPKKLKEGKPNVAILVASKAGQLWKELDDATKKEFNEKAASCKSKEPTPEPVVKSNPKTEKKQENEDDEVNVESYTHNGVEYYLDTDNLILYDIKTEEEVGKITDGKVVMN